MRRAGFTLIEVAVVLLLLALATALTIPALRAPERPDDLTLAAQELERLFGAARAAALRRGAPVTVAVDSASAVAWVIAEADAASTGSGDVAAAGTPLGLPPSVQLQLTSARARFSFAAGGAAFGDTIVLRQGLRTIALTLDPWTGDVLAH